MAGTLAHLGARVARRLQIFVRRSGAEVLLQPCGPLVGRLGSAPSALADRWCGGLGSAPFGVSGPLVGRLLRGGRRLQAAASEVDQWSATCLAAAPSSLRIASAKATVSSSPARRATRFSSS